MSTSAALLTTKFREVLVLAAEWHAAQARKGSGVPYLWHLLGVVSLAPEFGANETEAVAALLHDALEDGPHHTGRSHQDLRVEIVRRFGEEVARLVDAATDPHGLKPAWAARKRAYLGDLPQASVSALLVSASDKLHNSRTFWWTPLPTAKARLSASPPGKTARCSITACSPTLTIWPPSGPKSPAGFVRRVGTYGERFRNGFRIRKRSGAGLCAAGVKQKTPY